MNKFRDTLEHGTVQERKALAKDIRNKLETAKGRQLPRKTKDRYHRWADRLDSTDVAGERRRARIRARSKVINNRERGLPDDYEFAKCQGKNLFNEPCKSNALTKDKVKGIDGKWYKPLGGYCTEHDPDLPYECTIKAKGAAGRKPRKIMPTRHEALEKMVRESTILLVEKHFNAVGLKIDPDTGEVTKDPELGAKLYGESKDGEIIMTEHDDLEAAQRAGERLLDRVFGRPRQSQEISGPGGRMIPIEVPSSKERAAEVAKILAESGALPEPSPQGQEKK